MKNNKIPKYPILIVSSDDLLQDLPFDIIAELWDNCPFSFGDTSYSLIRADHFKDWLLDIVNKDDHEDVIEIVESIENTLDELTRENIFVDLEH